MGHGSFHTLVKGLSLRRTVLKVNRARRWGRGGHSSTMASAFSTPACICHRSTWCRQLNKKLTLMLCWALGSLSLCPGCYPNSPKSVKKNTVPNTPVVRQQLQYTPRVRLASWGCYTIPLQKSQQLAVMLYACNSSTQKAEACQPGLDSVNCLKSK